MQLSTQDLLALFIHEGQDWSARAIHTALGNKGVDIASLERSKGLKAGVMRNVFYRRCPDYQLVIADIIGVPPSVIWPSRYQGKNADSKAA